METFYNAIPELVQRSAIALGFFDGVHSGHQAVIGNAIAEAKRQDLKPCLVTFRDHPRTLTQGTTPLLLTMIEQRLKLFADLGVETTLVLSFTEELCRLSPEDYVKNILVGAMGAKLISVGYNHHFGRNREGDATLLTRLGECLGFSVKVASPIFVDGMEVSSSKIRDAISSGNMTLAKKLLSRPYAIVGSVVEGAGRGKTLGFPTANILSKAYQVMPSNGVYAGLINIDNADAIACVINIGVRPTFTQSELGNDPTSKPLVEVHILDFSKDIYGQNVSVSFCQYLRAEQKFQTIATLKTQILADCDTARAYFQSQINGNKSAQEIKPEQRLPA